MKTEFRKQISWCEHYGVCQSVNCVSCPNKKGEKMTKEEIIEMGHKAKLPYDYVTGELMWLDSIEQFARLVAEKEREKCAELIPPQYFHFRDWIRARGKV